MQNMFKENHLLTDEEKKKVRATWHSQTAVADQWSSSYCCMSFVPKLAQWGITTLNAANIDAIKKVVSEEIEVLGYIEHNRWNMEKLLLGYRKPHADEQAEIDECRQHIADIEKDKELKNQCKYKIYKGKHIHDYLRSFDDLATVTWVGMDREKDDVRKIDYDMLQQIPWIINNNDNYEQNQVHPQAHRYL